MKRVELILWSLAILGEILSLVPVPGGIVLFVLMMTLLMLFYFICSTFLILNIKTSDLFNKAAYRGIPQAHIFIASGCGPILALVCLGIIFKMLRWPAALLYLLYPVLLSLPVIIVSVVKLLQKKHVTFYRTIITKVGILIVVCICLFRTSSLFFSKIRYRNYPAYIEVANQLSADPHNRDLMQKERDETEKINHNR